MGEVIDIFKNRRQSYSELMNRWFDQWYPDGVDWEPKESNLDPRWQERTISHLEEMAWACIDDLENIWGVKLDFLPESISNLEQYITPAWRHQLQSSSDPLEFSNRFLVVVCEIGCYLAKTMLTNLGGRWVARAPYWESSILLGEEEIYVFTVVIQRFAEGINNPRMLTEWYQSWQEKFLGSGQEI
ncbi:MAG: hypothetical protein M0Z31_01490 [Clostridia bacterium]|nr:hypothetical protein [Clostridia bacterium]